MLGLVVLHLAGGEDDGAMAVPVRACELLVVLLQIEKFVKFRLFVKFIDDIIHAALFLKSVPYCKVHETVVRFTVVLKALSGVLHGEVDLGHGGRSEVVDVPFVVEELFEHSSDRLNFLHRELYVWQCLFNLLLRVLYLLIQ